MTNDEQIAICKAIAGQCMYGYGGVGSIIIDELQRKLPMEHQWADVYQTHKRQAEYERVGTITDEKELQSWLRRGYWLTNYRPGELALFNPPPMNGLAMYVIGELADRYGAIHDPHNFRVYQLRSAHQP